MKFKDLLGDPVPLDLTSVDSPLPTTEDLFKHAHYLITKATEEKQYWDLGVIYRRVADHLITLYSNRSLPTAGKTVIVR